MTTHVAGTPFETGTIGQIIISAVNRFAERPALADACCSWTYRDFAAAIGRLIGVLESLGLEPGQGLAILSGNRVEQVACQYAAVLMGLRYTALHPLAALSTHEVILRDAEVSALVFDPAALGGVTPKFAGELPDLRHVLSFGPVPGAADILSMMAAHEVPRPLTDRADPNGVAYLFYTGGTTGRPKGVMLPHRSIVFAAVLQGADWDLPAGDIRFLAVTPTSHASGVILPTIFLKGGYVRLATGFNPEEFCITVVRERINMTFLVPTMLYVLLDHPARSKFDLSSLETIVYGAAPISPDRLKSAIDAFGPVFVQLYGQTEVPMCITTLRKADHHPERLDRLASCGLPAPSVQVRLCDSEMREVADGEPGEICVRGGLVMDGYWKQPELSAEAFRGGWLHTGDVARRSPDGYLTIVDRTKDMIISGGFNVYPREVEDALLAHPAVWAAAVVGLPDPKWGEAVTAYVVRWNESVDEETLKAHVRTLRGAVWVPKSIRFVDKIPVTALGKVDRKALRGS